MLANRNDRGCSVGSRVTDKILAGLVKFGLWRIREGILLYKNCYLNLPFLMDIHRFAKYSHSARSRIYTHNQLICRHTHARTHTGNIIYKPQ